MKKIFYELYTIAVWSMCMLFPNSTSAVETQIIRKNDTVNIVAPINDDTYKRMVQMYKKQPYSTISITSNGGNYDSGMKMAQLVYRNNINVYVPRYCASACTFVFFGAKLERRDIAPTAMLGLHNVSFETEEVNMNKTILVKDAIEFAQSAVVRSGMMMSLYSANGIPSDVLLKVSQAYGNQIVNVQRDDLIKWGTIEEKSETK